MRLGTGATSRQKDTTAWAACTTPAFGGESMVIRRDIPRETRLSGGVPAVGDWNRILWKEIVT